MKEFINAIFANIEGLENTSYPLQVAIVFVGGLIAILAVVSVFISIVLSIRYLKYNKQKNSVGMCGMNVARKILDDNDLQKIKVSATGSLLFGNSYGHYFKKVRLRRLIYKKDSLTSLAIAAQKSALAVMDKEGDPDMKARVKLTPIMTFGPYAVIPLIVIGVLIDILLLQSNGVATVLSAGIGLLFYLISFILSVKQLKTEIKGQERAYEILRAENMATEEEIEDMKKLFKIYNVEYVNDMLLALLELIYRILMIFAKVQNSKTND